MSPSRMACTKGPSSQANGTESLVASSASLSLRAGRNPPRKSPVSVCWWQLRMRSFCPLNSARSWHTEVLPHPVSPTSNAGSLCSRQLSTSENNRRAAGVHAIAAESADASAASRRATRADTSASVSFFVFPLTDVFPAFLRASRSAASAVASALVAASVSLCVKLASSAEAYKTENAKVSSLRELSTFKIFTSVSLSASRSSSDLKRSPKVLNPSRANSS
mmetsp:Transcript_8084/g.34366  ORF Transcript_8084/g.34366 Transcript_8084/m.34366 type:complete len:221 (-) Transcript_8084:1495-2157(-)